MEFSNMTAEAISTELGIRLRQARLNQDLSQEQLANKIGLTSKTVSAVEKGRAHFTSIVSIMMGLGMMDNLSTMIPDAPLSPIQLAKMQGKQRQRASKKGRNKQMDNTKVNW